MHNLTMLMNIKTGSVATFEEWYSDYKSMPSEQWGSKSFFANDNLIEVIWDNFGNYERWIDEDAIYTAVHNMDEELKEQSLNEFKYNDSLNFLENEYLLLNIYRAKHLEKFGIEFKIN